MSRVWPGCCSLLRSSLLVVVLLSALAARADPPGNAPSVDAPSASPSVVSTPTPTPAPPAAPAAQPPPTAQPAPTTAPPAPAAPPAAAEAPVIKGAQMMDQPAATAATHELLVFKGTLLLNEFIYRAILKLPPDAKADRETARKVRRELAGFLADAGYELAKVKARVKGDVIEVQVDEGSLDKILFIGAGWITSLRFRAALNLPLDVFNSKLFGVQMPRLARQFGLRGYRYELWPVHLLDVDNAASLDDVEELRAMPTIRPARGYELRIFALTEQWGSGFSPEVDIGGSIGYGLGGRYRFKDLIQAGDRWQVHFRVGGAFRGSLDPGGSTQFVNSQDYLSLRWLSKPWDDSSHGLRMTISPQLQFWTLQRADLALNFYRIATLDFGSGAGAQLSTEFSLYFTLGLQRRWIFELTPTAGTTLPTDVTNVPGVGNRFFLRLNSAYIFNVSELKQDLRNTVSLDLNAYRPTNGYNDGYIRLDVQARKVFQLGWHELRVGLHYTGEQGSIAYVDEIPLEDHLRIGFGLVKYTERVGSNNLEFRYSLLRDKIKVGLYNDFGVWQALARDDSGKPAKLAGSFGGGLFFFVWDTLQVDAYYGAGWATNSSLNPGFALAIKEAF